MILTDKEILANIASERIVITPFRRECLGSNSYDVHLGKLLATYDEDILDAKVHNTSDFLYFLSVFVVLNCTN